MGLKGYFQDRLFFFLLVFTFVILSIIIYISITSPSKEEFVEVYWQVFRANEFNSKTDVNCKLFNCSKSRTYKIGNIDLNGKIFGIVLIDREKAGDYNSLCIDSNNDNVYCDDEEGPFGERGSFSIDSGAFNVIAFKENDIVIAHYPKEVHTQNFTIGFVIKSHYFHTGDFNISLFVNESLENSNTLKLGSKEETLSKFEVSLPSEGLFKVKVFVSPVETNEKANIDFWVNYTA
jgi:hypothetical protein